MLYVFKGLVRQGGAAVVICTINIGTKARKCLYVLDYRVSRRLEVGVSDLVLMSTSRSVDAKCGVGEGKSEMWE